MAADIGAAGSIGVALETTPGTYVAPTKFFPLASETLKFMPQNKQRRGIRQVADVIGGIAGNYHFAGDIVMEFFEEVAVYFLKAARTNLAKTGATNFVYTFTGAHAFGLGTGGKTLSVTIVRSGTRQAYTGVQVGSFKLAPTDGVLMATWSVAALEEATQTDPTESYPTTQVPYGPGVYTIEVPTGTAVTDADVFEFSVDDAIDPQFRLTTTRGPSFFKYGERTVALTMTRDFTSRTDYDAFKAFTPQTITLKSAQGANNYCNILVPVAYKDAYEFNLSGQGDLVRAQITYFSGYDATTTAAYKVTVGTQEDIT